MFAHRDNLKLTKWHEQLVGKTQRQSDSLTTYIEDGGAIYILIKYISELSCSLKHCQA